MNEFASEMDFLLKEVASAFGGPVQSSGDFESLSARIMEKTGQPVSTSTLKRLYGYMSLKPTPRMATLDILSRFIGRNGFRALCSELQESSAFLSYGTLESASLEDGREVLLGWFPDRKVRLRHLSGTEFVVVDSGTSKLRPGDSFSVISIAKGHPLYLSGIRRDGELLPEYVAGRTAGIREIEIL